MDIHPKIDYKKIEDDVSNSHLSALFLSAGFYVVFDFMATFIQRWLHDKTLLMICDTVILILLWVLLCFLLNKRFSKTERDKFSTYITLENIGYNLFIVLFLAPYFPGSAQTSPWLAAMPYAFVGFLHWGR